MRQFKQGFTVLESGESVHTYVSKLTSNCSKYCGALGKLTLEKLLTEIISATSHGKK